MRDILVSTAIWGLIIVELESKHRKLCACVCKCVYVYVCVWFGLFSLQFWPVGRIRLCNIMCGNRSQPLAMWEAQTTVYCSVVTLEHRTPDCSRFPARAKAVATFSLSRIDLTRVGRKRNYIYIFIYIEREKN